MNRLRCRLFWIFAAMLRLMACDSKVMAPETNGVEEAVGREIMGQNFFGIAEAIKYFGVNPSKQELAALAKIPWSEETLRSVQYTHILVAVFPISLIDIDIINQRLFYFQPPLFGYSAWFGKYAFGYELGEAANWQLIRKTYVPGSINTTWDGQQALLDVNEETPTARVMAYAILGHYQATGKRLFPIVSVRCPDLYFITATDFFPNGLMVQVGFLAGEGSGIDIYGNEASERSQYIGVASALKPREEIR